VARTSGGKAGPARRTSSPDLTDFDAERLESGRDYEGILFADRDFTGQDAEDARFLECRLDRCGLDGLSMRRVRLVDCLLAEVHGANVDLSDSTWHDTRMSGGRIGAMNLAGATWKRVRLEGVKLGFVNFAAARLDEVVFDGCEIGSLDAGAAQMRSVQFVDCAVTEINVDEATLAKVDLSGAMLRTLTGIGSLRGAIVSHQQLLDLAPLLASQLGLEVRAD
jgi:uncharacterized protein YjbI with pentapeptide repeats